jgi:para-aminobenzoate synthetase/4-amino-4-deoxychorismate lyase
VLTSERPEFRLLETLLWEPGEGYFLLDRHLQRLRASARYFGFREPRDLEEHLRGQALRFAVSRQRVRILLDADGEIELQHERLGEGPPEPWRVSLARAPVSSEDVFLYHKTTHRGAYERAQEQAPGCDDVLLWNERGELTESTVANLVLDIQGERLTPAADCGLLPGTFRAQLLESGEIREATLQVEDLRHAEAVYLVNSVRRWIPVELERPRQ